MLIKKMQVHVKGSIFSPRLVFVLFNEGRNTLRVEEMESDMEEVKTNAIMKT